VPAELPPASPQHGYHNDTRNDETDSFSQSADNVHYVKLSGKAGSCSLSWPPPPNTSSNCAPNGGRRPDAARKKHIGRPKVTGPAELATLRRLLGDSASVTQAAGTLKISRSAAYAALASTH